MLDFTKEKISVKEYCYEEMIFLYNLLVNFYLTNYLLDAKTLRQITLLSIYIFPYRFPSTFTKKTTIYIIVPLILCLQKRGTSYSLADFRIIIEFCAELLMHFREALISKIKSTYKEITGSSS